MNFAEQQRRNRQRTVLLIGAFVAALRRRRRARVDLDRSVRRRRCRSPRSPRSLVAGRDQRCSAGGAAPTGCWRRCSPSRCATTTPSIASWPTSPARWRSPPACRARACSSFPIRRPTRSPPARRRATPPSPSPPARSPCSTARRRRAWSRTRWRTSPTATPPVMTLVSVLFGGLLDARRLGAAQPLLRPPGQPRHQPARRLVLPLLVLLTPLLSRLLAMAVSRRREYLADATARGAHPQSRGPGAGAGEDRRQRVPAARRDPRDRRTSSSSARCAAAPTSATARWAAPVRHPSAARPAHRAAARPGGA